MESVENIKDAEGTTMSLLTKKLVADLKVLKDLLLLLPDERPAEVIEIINERLNQHYYKITNSKDPQLIDAIILAESFISIYHINIIRFKMVEEYLYIRELLLTRSMILLKDKELDSKAIVTAIETFNELSYTYIQQGDPMRSLQCLNKALELYNTYTKGQDDFPAPIDILYAIGIEKISHASYLLDTKYMHILKSLIMLSHKVKHELIDMEKMIACMQKLLKKQLECKEAIIDGISWATNIIKLAQYFLSHKRFSECKIYLGLASIMMRSCFNHYYFLLNIKMQDEKLCFLFTFFKSIVSCILTCWVQYGLVLLYSSSKQMLEMKNRDNLYKANNTKPESTTKSVKQLTESLMSPATEQLSEGIIYIAEDNYITNYDDAKRIFARILELLNYLKTDEIISSQAAARVEIVQYISRAYKYLASYEHDKIKRLKLQKQRIKVLEDCLETLHVERDQMFRSFIYFELAVINSTVLGMKIDGSDEDKLIAKELSEIDQLVKNSVKYFQLYMANYESVQYGLADKRVNKNYIVYSSLSIKYTPRKYVTF